MNSLVVGILSRCPSAPTVTWRGASLIPFRARRQEVENRRSGEQKMIRNFTKQLLSATLSLLLIIGTPPLGAQAQQTGSAGYSGQGVPLSAEELQQLVAPIGLY